MFTLNHIFIVIPELFFLLLFVFNVWICIALFIIVLHPLSQVSIVPFRLLLRLHLILIVKVFELLVFFCCFYLPAVFVDIADQLKSVVSHHTTKSLVYLHFWYFVRDLNETWVVGDSLKSFVFLIFWLLRLCPLNCFDFTFCFEF